MLNIVKGKSQYKTPGKGFLDMDFFNELLIVYTTRESKENLRCRQNIESFSHICIDEEQLHCYLCNVVTMINFNSYKEEFNNTYSYNLNCQGFIYLDRFSLYGNPLDISPYMKEYKICNKASTLSKYCPPIAGQTDVEKPLCLLNEKYKVSFGLFSSLIYYYNSKNTERNNVNLWKMCLSIQNSYTLQVCMFSYINICFRLYNSICDDPEKREKFNNCLEKALDFFNWIKVIIENNKMKDRKFDFIFEDNFNKEEFQDFLDEREFSGTRAPMNENFFLTVKIHDIWQTTLGNIQALGDGYLKQIMKILACLCSFEFVDITLSGDWKTEVDKVKSKNKKSAEDIVRNYIQTEITEQSETGYLNSYQDTKWMTRDSERVAGMSR